MSVWVFTACSTHSRSFQRPVAVWWWACTDCIVTDCIVYCVFNCVDSLSTYWSLRLKLRHCVIIKFFSSSLKVFITHHCFNAVDCHDVCPSVCLSIHLYVWDGQAPWCQCMSTYSQPSFSSSTWKRGGVWMNANYAVAGRSGLVVSASDCSVKGPRFKSHRRRLCLSRQPLRYTALGTGCTPLLQCLGRLEPSTLRWMVKWVWAFGLSNNNMAMVDVDDSSLPADSQPKSIGLVWGLAVTWRWVCIHHMNRVNSLNGTMPWWQHHKYHRGYYYYYIMRKH